MAATSLIARAIHLFPFQDFKTKKPVKGNYDTEREYNEAYLDWLRAQDENRQENAEVSKRRRKWVEEQLLERAQVADQVKLKVEETRGRKRRSTAKSPSVPKAGSPEAFSLGVKRARDFYETNRRRSKRQRFSSEENTAEASKLFADLMKSNKSIISIDSYEDDPQLVDSHKVKAEPTPIYQPDEASDEGLDLAALLSGSPTHNWGNESYAHSVSSPVNTVLPVQSRPASSDSVVQRTSLEFWLKVLPNDLHKYAPTLSVWLLHEQHLPYISDTLIWKMTRDMPVCCEIKAALERYRSMLIGLPANTNVRVFPDGEKDSVKTPIIYE